MWGSLLWHESTAPSRPIRPLASHLSTPWRWGFFVLPADAVWGTFNTDWPSQGEFTFGGFFSLVKRSLSHCMRGQDRKSWPRGPGNWHVESLSSEDDSLASVWTEKLFWEE